MQSIACAVLLDRRAKLVALAMAAPESVRNIVFAQIDQVDRSLAAFGCTIPTTTTSSTTTSTSTTTTVPNLPPGIAGLACTALLAHRANLVALSVSVPAFARGPVLAQIAEVDRSLAAFGCPIPVAALHVS